MDEKSIVSLVIMGRDENPVSVISFDINDPTEAKNLASEMRFYLENGIPFQRHEGPVKFTGALTVDGESIRVLE